MKKTLYGLLFCATLSGVSAQNWEPMAAGMLPNNFLIFSLSTVSEQVVWAVASQEYYQPPIPNSHRIRVLRTSDGGQTWVVKEVEEAAGTISFQIVGVDSLTAWITTQDYGGGPGRALFQTNDGGETWTKKLSNNSAGVSLNRFPDGQHWLATNRQTTSRSADDGENWTNSSYSGYFTNEYQGLYAGSNMASTVGDTLWHGTSQGGRIVRFTNFGQNVSMLIGLGSTASVTSVAFHDHLNGLAFYTQSNQYKIAKTTDGGGTWAALPLAQQPGGLVWNIAAVPGAIGHYVLASAYATTNGKIAITTDFGESWTVETIGRALNGVSFSSPVSGWVGGGKITSSTQPAMFKYIGSPLVGAKKVDALLPGFAVSPNPAADFVQFDFEGFVSANTVFATVSDVSGRMVFSGEVSGNQLDTSKLPVGAYFLKVETGGKTGVAKILKH